MCSNEWVAAHVHWTGSTQTQARALSSQGPPTGRRQVSPEVPSGTFGLPRLLPSRHLSGSAMASTHLHSLCNCVEKTPTQLSTWNGEVPLKNGPLLDVVGSCSCIHVDSLDPFFDGLIHGLILLLHNLRYHGGFAAHPLAELHGLFCQIICGLKGVRVQSALKSQRQIRTKRYCTGHMPRPWRRSHCWPSQMWSTVSCFRELVLEWIGHATQTAWAP